MAQSLTRRHLPRGAQEAPCCGQAPTGDAGLTPGSLSAQRLSESHLQPDKVSPRHPAHMESTAAGPHLDLRAEWHWGWGARRCAPRSLPGSLGNLNFPGASPFTACVVSFTQRLMLERADTCQRTAPAPLRPRGPSQGGGVHPQRTDFSGSAPRGLRCVPTRACPKEVARLQACKPVPTAQAAGKGSDRASLARGPRHLAGRGPGQPCPEAAGHLGEEEAQGLLLGSVGTCSGRGLAPSGLPAKPMLIGRGDCASRAGRAHSLVGHGGQGQVRPLPLHQHSPHLLQLRGGLWLQVGSQGDLVPEA